MITTQAQDYALQFPSQPFGKKRQIALLAVALFVSGCNSQIKQLPDSAQVDVPDQWEVQIKHRTGEAQGAEETAPEPMPQGPVENGWLSGFGDADLVNHTQTALENNPNLLASAAQLKSAIEQVTITGAQLWPRVQANYRDNDTQVKGPAGGVSTVGGVAVDSSAGGATGGTVTTEVRTISATLDVSWEADIWGKLTQRKKSAALNAKAQAETFKAAEFSLVANVSRAWYNMITNKLQVELAEQRLDSFKRTAALIDENYKRGLRSALDVYLSRTDVQVQVSNLADAEFNYSQSLRTFKTLLGEYPDSDLKFEAVLPEIADPVPAGLPAELLARRPDIRASQLQYEAQIASAKAANRDRFPSLTLSGSIGDSRDEFDALFENDNMIRTLVAGLVQPVFLAGELKAREQSAVYQAEASYANLVNTTLTAFQEVEDSLSREHALKAQHVATKEAVKFAQGGLDLALDRYQSGIENYQTVLEAQRRLFDSRRNEINIRNALLQNRIAIHLALGGDFSTTPDRNPADSLPQIAAETSE